MTDKIRIVGSFPEDVASQVRTFVESLDGVQTVSVLRDGVEQYKQTEDEQQATAETAETA